MTVYIDGKVITWNGFFYGYSETESGIKYYKSHTCRFDDTMGGTEEITQEEYIDIVIKYAKIFMD